MTSNKFRDFKCRFTFHDDLVFFLSPGVNASGCIYQFNGKPSVKDAIESQGIPHTEVGLIAANGITVDFGYHCVNGDSFDVYSANSENVIKNGSNLRNDIAGLPRFILDVHLGKLARHLRLLGFDCLYRNDFDDPDIVRLCSDLDRVVLTRDRRLLCIRTVTHGYCLRSDKPEEQVAEVIRRFDLSGQMRPFTRCIECNGELVKVDKSSIIEHLEEKTILYFDHFMRCRDCAKIYWRGSHCGRLVHFVKSFTYSHTDGCIDN